MVDLVIEDGRWRDFGLQPLAERAVGAALAELDLPETGFSLCLLGCDDARIAALNGDFRGKAQPTNVLSWPAQERSPAVPGARPEAPEPGTAEEPEALGDIAIAYETCLGEARQAGKAAEDHVTHLVVHGLLHLLGYDHVDDADAAVMEALEVRILARLGISDPY